MSRYIFSFILSLAVSISLAGDTTGLFSKSYGDANNPAILYLHGGPGYNSVLFELSTASVLAEKGYYVIVFDQRGCGRSRKMKKSEYTREEALSDMIAIYDRYKIKTATLIGHSWGGILGTWFTESYPDKVDKLVLTGAPLSLQKTFKTILRTCKKIYIENNSSQLKYIEQLENMDSTSLEYSSYCLMHAMANRTSFYAPKNPSEESKAIYKAMKESPDAKYLSSMERDPVSGFYKSERYTTIDLSSSLKKLSGTKKIYGIYGSEDGLYDAEHMAALKVITGENNFAVIDNASHNVFIDQQTKFIDQLVKFFSKQ